MTNIKELFIKTINAGLDAAQLISDASDKAQAYAALANAIATTGLLCGDRTAVVEGKEALKPENSKGTKSRSKKKDAPAEQTEPVKVEEVQVQEETVEEVAVAPTQEETVTDGAPVIAQTEENTEIETAGEEAVESVNIGETEIVDEWTDEMAEMFAAEIAFINELKEVYEEEALDSCVEQFSEGNYHNLGDVSPLTIRGFVDFMKSLIAEADAE